LLSDAAAEFRSTPLPEGLEGRINARIDAASRARPALSARRNSFTWPAMAVGAALVAALLMFVVRPYQAAIDHQREVQVSLGAANETAWVEVDLLTHHHGDENVVFHIEAPIGVFVEHSAEHRDIVTIDAAECVDGTCRLVVAHPPGGVVGPPLRFGVAAPGAWSIKVTHHSRQARVTEAIELLAVN
jgi:hypothetical protein